MQVKIVLIENFLSDIDENQYVYPPGVYECLSIMLFQNSDGKVKFLLPFHGECQNLLPRRWRIFRTCALKNLDFFKIDYQIGQSDLSLPLYRG